MSPTHATKNRHKRYRYYVCVQAQQRGWQNCPAKSISAEPLERFVVEQLRALGAGANSLDSLRREDERRLAEFLRECEAARGELHNCDHEISRVRKQLDVNRVCDGKKVTTSERRLETARQEAATARNRLIALEAAHLRQQEAAECWRLFDPDWQELGAAVQGSILRRLMEHVEYDGPANSLAIQLKPVPWPSWRKRLPCGELLKCPPNSQSFIRSSSSPKPLGAASCACEKTRRQRRRDDSRESAA